MTQDNVSDFLFLCQNKIARSKREEIKDPHDLVCALEQLNILGRDNLRFFSSALTEIRRRDLAQKVQEHCQRQHGMQSSERDSLTRRRNDVSERGRFGASVRTNLMEDAWPSGSNLAVSYTPARLEPDDAEPFVQFRQLTLEELADDSQILYEELIESSMPASIDHHLPRYTMNKKPRGTVALLLFSIYSL